MHASWPSLGLADRRLREALGKPEGGASFVWALTMSNLGGAEIVLGGDSMFEFVVTGILDGSSKARIQGVIEYSSANTKACSAGIQILPAVSSGLVVGRDLMYLRSVSSSKASA